jgi:hypothetical protein
MCQSAQLQECRLLHNCKVLGTSLSMQQPGTCRPGDPQHTCPQHAGNAWARFSTGKHCACIMRLHMQHKPHSSSTLRNRYTSDTWHSQGSEGDTYRSIPHSSDMHMGQPTVRTRRKLNSLVDPDWLRVMLPAASRRAQMPAHNTPMQREPVSRLDAQPSPTLQPPGQPGHEDEPSTRSLAARISDDSIDQQQPQQVPTQSTSPFKKEVKSDVVSDVSKKASTRALPPLQMSDVALERDVGPPVSSRPPASARPRRCGHRKSCLLQLCHDKC